ncbi:hypothetical protein KFE25_001416 [Diacronema lutheri]|uniref:Bystin n=1 Tax=Diacronema lutheri TaxID=2081491 RepID=A0A8J6CBS8_DIALT|nr:hypothetical protein KFE25_001416 [Diacronema lutheri]
MGRQQTNRSDRHASPARRAPSPARAPQRARSPAGKRVASERVDTAKRARARQPSAGERRGAQRARGGGSGGDGDDDDDDDDDDDRDELREAPVPEDLSRKIMRQARAQQEEFEADAPKPAARRGGGGGDDDDDDDEYDGQEEAGWEEEVEEVEVDEADEALLAKLMPADSGARRTLADVILEKLAEKAADAQARAAGLDGADGAAQAAQLPEKVVAVYSSIGELLHRYRSGKLPKAFKIVPKLANWEEILFLTQPRTWSPQATAAAVRLFASALNPRMAQRFYALVLLPATLDDIDENRRLNYHYYAALKKAVYKPAAFFKGIVLPMCDAQCALKHAVVVCSVLSKVSVPAAHSAVTLLKLTEMPLSGAQLLFLRTLLLKKYALPYRVVDALADYFARFGEHEGELPVIWHQSLLVFAQHYKMELTLEQKDELKPVLRAHLHERITAEIRRELFNSACRGDPYVPESDMLP